MFDDVMPGNPSNQLASTYDSTYSLGQFTGGPGGAYRGGGFGYSNSGVYALAMDHGGGTNANYGFRCVYRP
ncbi:MAG: hypothetical protein KA715_13760 [Xanthomonadaceae bacterium]|nr:hypothetical protein [Xanthomonadaceae bacterium]